MMVRQRGEIVLAEAVGVAHPTDRQPLTVNKTFQVMSVSKAVVAFAAVAVLEDRGLVEVTAPVARIWPAFGAHGKEQVTILDVLTHQSGLVAERLVNDPERWRDWEGLTEALAAARPDYRRGTIAYESHSFGCRSWVRWFAVRRDGGIDAFVAELLAAGIDGLRFRAPRAERGSRGAQSVVGESGLPAGRGPAGRQLRILEHGFFVLRGVGPGCRHAGRRLVADRVLRHAVARR